MHNGFRPDSSPDPVPTLVPHRGAPLWSGRQKPEGNGVENRRFIAKTKNTYINGNINHEFNLKTQHENLENDNLTRNSDLQDYCKADKFNKIPLNSYSLAIGNNPARTLKIITKNNTHFEIYMYNR